MSPTTETFDLLARWRRGDREALAALLQRDLAWLRGRVRQQLGPGMRKAGDTEDFVQEVTLAVLEDGPRFLVSDKQQFRALMARIVSNVMCDHHRRLAALKRGSSREQTLPPDSVLNLDGAPSSPQPVRDAQHTEEKEWLRLGLLLLSAPDQETLDLHWQGLTDAEIGARIGLEANSARMRRTRATSRLVRAVQQLKCGEIDRAFLAADGAADRQA